MFYLLLSREPMQRLNYSDAKRFVSNYHFTFIFHSRCFKVQMYKVCVYEAIILSQLKCSCLNVKRKKSRIKILSNLRKTLIHVSKKAYEDICCGSVYKSQEPSSTPSTRDGRDCSTSLYWESYTAKVVNQVSMYRAKAEGKQKSCRMIYLQHDTIYIN